MEFFKKKTTFFAKNGVWQLVIITLFSVIAITCYAVINEYSGNLPEMGDSDRSQLSPSDANFLGQQVIREIQNIGDMADDYDTLAYLDEVGDNLVSYSRLAGDNFKFYLVKDKQINAFALPGGYICVYNGLIYTTQSEAELISVLSHEIGHVVQHHIFRNMAVYNRSQWLSIAGLLAGGLLAAVNPGAAILAITGGQGIAIQNILSFSRDFEREADRVGQVIMNDAGFDANAMPSFFKRLQATNKFNDNGAYAFLRTHPVTAERISEAEARARLMQIKMRPDSTSFLLIREKVRIRQLSPLQAINFYQQAIKAKKYTNINAQYYGLALAQLANQNIKEASLALAKIADLDFINHPAVLGAKALILVANKSYKQAANVYEKALDSYPEYKGLWLGQVDLYLNSKQLIKAGQKLDSLGQLHPGDIDIWSRMASLYSDTGLNNQQKYLYAIGNKLYLLGEYRGAIEHYQQALRIKNGDATLNDVISAKVIDTREQLKLKSQFTKP